MKCLYCKKLFYVEGRKYCNFDCYNKSKIGKKRPDVALRNKTNNPIHNIKSLEKMRKSLTGKKQTKETKLKRANKLREYYKNNPEAKARLAKNVWDKYTSKIAGTGWAKVRLKVLDRDNYTCQNCGEDNRSKLMVHHLDWRGKRRNVPSKEWNNKMSNLQTLCFKCHNGIHRHKAKDYQSRLNDQIAP